MGPLRLRLRSIAAALAAFVLAIARPAAADLDDARVFISIERAFGVGYYAGSNSRAFQDSGFSLFAPWAGGENPSALVARVPRLGVDWARHGFTLGAVVLGTPTSTDTEFYGNRHTKDFVLGAGPRVGWKICESWGCVWLKASLTVATMQSTLTVSPSATTTEPDAPGSSDRTYTLVDLSVEPTLLIHLAPHVAATLAFTYDEIAGRWSGTYGNTTLQSDVNMLTFGASLGVLGWL